MTAAQAPLQLNSAHGVEQSFLSQNVIYGLKPLKHLGLVFHLTKKFRMRLKVLSGTQINCSHPGARSIQNIQ